MMGMVGNWTFSQTIQRLVVPPMGLDAQIGIFTIIRMSFNLSTKSLAMKLWKTSISNDTLSKTSLTKILPSRTPLSSPSVEVDGSSLMA